MRLFRRTAPIAVLSATALVLAGCAGAPDSGAEPTEATGGGFPVELSSCGHTATLEEAPQNAVTLNQGATEVALALGVADRLAGTAYLDDEIPEKWAAAYESVPVLAEQYPAREEFLAASPDFAYASYASAFEADAVGTQDELAADGTPSYLSPSGCPEALGPEPSFEAVWDEVADVAGAFGVPGRAEDLVSEQRATLEALAEQAAGDGVEVLWLDQADKTASVGAGDGGPQLVMDAVGATNVFADLEGGWADASWEKVVATDPDVIVLSEAAWSTAEQKRTHLEQDPVLGQLRAVREESFVVVPFSESTPGVRLVDGAERLADGLADLEED